MANLIDLVEHLGLDYTKSGYTHCVCPECSKSPAREKKLHLDFAKNQWRCVKCGQAGGVLRFYNIVINGDISLPSSKEERAKLYLRLEEFIGGKGTTSYRPSYTTRPKTPSIPVAKDNTLHQVYSEILGIPELYLRQNHRKELLRRGLTTEAIERNQYRSVPMDWMPSQSITDMYENAGGDQRTKALFSWMNPNRVKFGLMVAYYLTEKGFNLTGVPGFFRFGELWCWWTVPGILIPTRNIRGQIVIFQVRRDEAKPGMAKYITVSSQTLPGHTNGEVSRCHFPLNNAPISADVPVLVTEGPLKADVASCLCGKPVLFAAVPGILTTKDFFKNCKVLKKAGVKTIYNCFDMDKITNRNVRKGCVALRTSLGNMGFLVRDLYWGQTYANFLYTSLSMLARIRRISVTEPPHDSLYERIAALSEALDLANINFCKFITPDGKEVTNYWDSNTKGIDDYLLLKRRNGACP